MRSNRRRVFWLPSLTAAACFLSSTCLADVWIDDLTPVQVVTGTDSIGQYVQLIVRQTVNNPAGCLNAESYISRTLPEATLAVALAAITTGRFIKIYLKTAAGACDPSFFRPAFTAVGVDTAQ